MKTRTKDEIHELIKNHLKDVDFTEKKMFGGLAFFINRNMFTGTHQSHLFLRLSPDDREGALTRDGINVYEPRKGMIMGEYIALTESVLENTPMLKELFRKSVSYASSLPPKESKKKKR